jgi:DNA polymerase-1
MPSVLPEAGAPDAVYVVDLSSYLFRAYHAVAPLSSPRGEPTHAVHGTVTMLERLLRERRPAYAAIALDSGRRTFRHDLYPEYKANRPEAPEDLVVQLTRAEEVVRAQGFAVFKQEGVEADDLIASLVLRLQRRGLRVVIVSADKDLMQLVGDGVLMWDTLRRKVIGPPEVIERFGVRPDQVGDLLALMGDASDNVPGVPSVGAKTAASLLGAHGTLDGIYAHLEDVSQKRVRESLEAHEADARLSRRLVELRSDCPVDDEPEQLRVGAPGRVDRAALAALYVELGFTRQLAALGGEAEALQSEGGEVPAARTATSVSEPGGSLPVAVHGTAAADAPGGGAEGALTSSHAAVLLAERLGELAQALEREPGGAVALELHTTSPAAHRGPLVGLAVAGASFAFYIPLSHRYVGAPSPADGGAVVDKVVSLLAGRSRVTVHDLKRTVVLLRGAGAKAALPSAHDTMLASYLLDPEQTHDVSAVGARVSRSVPDFDVVSRDGRKRRALDELDVETTARFAGARVAAILAAEAPQRTALERAELLSLLDEVELPLARLLAEMELSGVLIDTSKLETIGAACQSELDALEAKAAAIAGRTFNLSSPRQLEVLLFDELGLKPQKRTKTSRSTDAQTLEALADEHELPRVVLQHRQIAKLKGTYIDALPSLVAPATGRVHGAWEQAVAATGRISSTEPNLQNIPIRTELGRRIRAAFIAPPGNRLVSADYSQIELRVLAHLSADPRLVEAFRTGQDVHTRTAMEVFEVAEDQVTREQRARAKAVNFGVIYGQGEGGLSKALGIDRGTAASFIAAYFRRYEGVRRFMEGVLERARSGEPVHSLLGRRRIVPDINSGNRARRLTAERVAMNMPIQGSAADILKLAMLRLATPPTPGSRLVLTVHDELVFEVPEDEVALASERIRAAMQSAYELSVPLEVSVGSGPNWNEAH